MSGFPHRLVPVLILSLLGLPALAAPTEETPPPAEELAADVVALVNGETVSLRDVERGLGQLHQNISVANRQGFDVDRLVFRLVNDLLLSQEARAMGFDEESAITENLREYREELALALMDRELIGEKARPDEEAVAKAYKDRFRMATLRVVTAYDEPGAEALLAELRVGADMETLARERSVDPIAIRGGLMKPAPVSDLQRSIADVAVTLETGELAGPIRTPLGWTVIRLERLDPADPEGLEAKRNLLEAVLTKQASGVMWSQRAARLREQVEVEYDPERVAEIQPQREPDGRLLPRVPDRSLPLVTIGGERIVTTGDYETALISRWTGVRNEAAARAAAPIVFEELIDLELLKIEARRLGYLERPEVEAKVQTRERKLLVDRYLSDVIAAGVEISPEELKSYYVDNRSRFNRPPRVRLGQVTVETEQLASEIERKLQDGADLAWLAEKHSIDRFKNKNGDRGWLDPTPGVDPFSDALLAGEPGDVLRPDGAEGNFAVIKILAKELRDPYPFEQVSGNVRQYLFDEKLLQAIDRYVSTLRERSEIRVFKDRLAELRIRGAQSEADAEEHGGMSHGH